MQGNDLDPSNIQKDVFAAPSTTTTLDLGLESSSSGRLEILNLEFGGFENVQIMSNRYVCILCHASTNQKSSEP